MLDVSFCVLCLTFVAFQDENPYETAKRLFEKTNFQTPIDEEDAMARILDPLLSGVNTGINAYGKFFKDYHETEW